MIAVGPVDPGGELPAAAGAGWHPYWWLPTLIVFVCVWFEAVTP